MHCDEVRGSHLDLWDRCQYAYMLTCHERRVPDIKVPRWAVLGWVSHKALEIAITEKISAKKAFIRVAQGSRQLCRDEFHSSWPDAGLLDKEIPELDGRDMERGRRMMEHFEHLRAVIEDFDSIVVERAFRIVIDEEGTIFYYGRIDYTGKRGSETLLLDYKSTRPGFEYGDVPPQLLRYAIAIAVTDKIPISQIRCILFNLDSGNVRSRRWTSEEANKMIDAMVRKVETIRATPPEKSRASVGDHCRTLCQYRPSCPYVKAARIA